MLSAVRSAALELLLPRICAVCHAPLRGDAMACGLCWSRCVPLPHPQCGRCGHPLAVTGSAPSVPSSRVATADSWVAAQCRYCEMFAPYVRAVRSWTWVDRGTGGPIVHAMKYAGWWKIGEEIGRRLARLEWPPDVVAERRLVLPVPLSPAKERERGYNQCAAIAATVARAWGVSARTDLLVRTRATRTQTRLTPGERLANVSGAFGVASTARHLLRGAHVVLIDDVITTGATLDACARALLDAGVRITSFLTFGRAPALGDR